MIRRFAMLGALLISPAIAIASAAAPETRVLMPSGPVASVKRKARRSYSSAMPKVWRTKNEKARRVRRPNRNHISRRVRRKHRRARAA